MDSLSWVVLLPRGDSRIGYNIFNSTRFREFLMDLRARHKKNPDLDLRELVDHGLMYSFWCKAEYEIYVESFLSDKEKLKIDVYTQIKMNYDRFFTYLIENWNKIPAKSYLAQRRAKNANK